MIAKNRPEWFTVDLANMLYDNCMVPLYDTYQPEVIEHIIEMTELTTMFASGEVCKKLSEVKQNTLKNLVILDPIEESVRTVLEERGLKIYTY